MTASSPSGGAALDRGHLALIFSITATGILSNTLVGPALPEILDDFDKADSAAGLFVAAGTLPGIVMAPLVGLAADRYGRRAVLVPCLTAFGLFGFLSVAATSFEVLLALRFLQGIGSAGLINLAVVLVGDRWEGVTRARILGWNSAVLTVSIAVFPPLGGLLTEIGGWRASFLPYVIGFVTAARIARGLPRARPEATPGRLRSAGAAVRQPVVLVAMGAGFVVFLLIFGLFLTALPVHLERELGVGPGIRGLVLSAPAIPSTISALNVGRLRHRLGARRMLLIGCTLFAVAFVIIGGASGLALVVAGAMLYGFGEGLFIPTMQDLVTAASPPAVRAAVVAVLVAAFRAGQTSGPLVAGAVYGATSTGTTFVLGGGVAAVLLIGLLIARMGEGADDHAPLPSRA